MVDIKGDIIKFEFEPPKKLRLAKATGEAVIIDGAILFRFSNESITKMNYDYEKKLGSIKVKYDERRKVYTEIYPGKTRDELREMLVKKFNEAGWRMQ